MNQVTEMILSTKPSFAAQPAYRVFVAGGGTQCSATLHAMLSGRGFVVGGCGDSAAALRTDLPNSPAARLKFAAPLVAERPSRFTCRHCASKATKLKSGDKKVQNSKPSYIVPPGRGNQVPKLHGSGFGGGRVWRQIGYLLSMISRRWAKSCVERQKVSITRSW